MKRRTFLKLFCITTLMLVLLAVATPTLALQSSAGLFRDAVNRPAMDLKASERGIVRTRYVDYNLDLLPGARARAAAGATVLLNLFPDRSFTAVLDHVENKPNGLEWVGTLQGIELSAVNIVTEGDVMAGSIIYPGGVYVIRYAGNGVHAVAEVDQSQYPPERSVIPTDPAPRDSYTPDPNAPADSAGTIDVMVVYTPAFATYAGGTAAANALVDLGVSQTNTTYANSGITQRVNLVYKGQVSYTEPGTGTDPDWDKALNDVTNGVGGLSGVPGLRNTYGADVVSLFTYWPTSIYCGLGWFMASVSAGWAPNAYDVVNADCVAGSLSYPHEMGHNMGADHDWYVSNTIDPYTYSHGRISLTATPKWRTVMSYNTLCSDQGFNCTRIAYWSNPGLSYGGASLGVAGGTNSSVAACWKMTSNPACDADNHRVLNNTALTVANFRQHTTPPPVGSKKVNLPLIRLDAPPAPTGPTPGYWQSENTSHEFYVTTSHTVRRHRMYFSACSSSWYAEITTDIPIVGNAFSYRSPSQPGPYVSGTFTSATTATVTDGFNGATLPCGTFNGGPWVRNYSWKNGTQVDIAADVTESVNVVPVPAGSNGETVIKK